MHTCFYTVHNKSASIQHNNNVIYHITSTTQGSNILCTIMTVQWTQGPGLRPLPDCHLLCVWDRNLAHDATHPFLIPSCDRNWNYACWVAIPIPAHAHRHVLCPDSIISGTRPKAPCANLMRTGRRGFGFAWKKLRIILLPIRNFNTAIYNNKLWFIYIKMISMPSGTYWCNQIQLIYKFT